jgi:hypothetical protein
METQNLDNFRKILPPFLVERAISLEEIGVHEFVWNWSDALSVIDILISNRIMILGGDVYSLEKNRFRSTGDSWYINSTCFIPAESDLINSRSISTNYINSYVEKNGENYYFSIVVRFL